MNQQQTESYERLYDVMQDKTPFVIDWDDFNQAKYYIDCSTITGNYIIDVRYKYQAIGAIYGSYEACQFIIDNHKKDLDILRGAL